MVSVLILCHVKMQILCAPITSVSAIAASEISTVNVLRVIASETLLFQTFKNGIGIKVIICYIALHKPRCNIHITSLIQ